MADSYDAHSLEELVEVCKETGAAGAWEEFVRRTHGVLRCTVQATMHRWNACQGIPVDDVVQEVYLKLSANRGAVLRNLQVRHPNATFGYLRAVAATVAHDYCKGLNAAKRGSGKSEPLWANDGAAEMAVPGEASRVEQEILIKEIDDLLRVAETGPTGRRDRTIFWLYYRQGFTAKAISEIPGINLTAKGVESTIHRLTRMVREHAGGRRKTKSTKVEWIRAKSSL